MYKGKKILAVIPARGGSKGIPRKNIKLLAGKPLIAYTIEAAKKSRLLDRIIVSTEDKEIASIAKKYGAEVTFMRPKELAGDEVLDLPVFQHAINWLEENENYKSEIILNLRPTNPFRTADDIDNAIKKLVDIGADSIKTISKVSQHPCRMWKLGKDDRLVALKDTEERVVNGSDNRRQALPEIYWQNELVDVCRRDNIIEKNTMFGSDRRGLIINRSFLIDLNTLEDFEIAEIIIKKRGVVV